MSRWRAAAIHLLISVAIFLLALSLMLTLWYPHPYFEGAGATGLLQLLVGVDVVIGPMLTLVIFKSGKKGLKFDLTVIAVLQLAALGYGMSVVAEARPAFVVFTIDRFDLVAANNVDLTGARYPQYQQLSWTGPVLAAGIPPKSAEERQQLLFGSVMAGIDVQNLAKLYEPYAPHAVQALARAKPLTALLQKHPEAKAQIAAFAEEQRLPMEKLVYLPLVARAGDMAMVLNKADGAVLGAVAVDPW